MSWLSKPSRRFRVAALVQMAGLASWLGAAAIAQQPYSELKQTGPRTLAVVLQCKPADRPELRHALTGGVAERLANLRSGGSLTSYSVLFSRFVDSETWDALYLVDFSGDKGLQDWVKMEETSPAGLAGGAAGLIASAHTYQFDDVSHATSPAVSSTTKPIYVVIPYTIEVSPDEYVQYANAYVIPQLQGWMKAGVLVSWRLLVNRYYAGRSWQALLVLGYRDEEALGNRERVVAEVRKQLSQDPQWKAVSDNKHKIRTELGSVTAEQIVGVSK
ncbi:MAG: hypothetical protein ACRD3E_18510 [Terriglobales bacterium]